MKKNAYFFFLIKKIKKKLNQNLKIFLGYKKINLWVATNQNSKRIAKMRYFDKIGWRKT